MRRSDPRRAAHVFDMNDTPPPSTSLAETIATLRAASRRLRAAALAAGGPTARWTRDTTQAHGNFAHSENVVEDAMDIANCPGGTTPPEDGREHAAKAHADLIALTQPAVALAVASWLESEAALLDALEPIVEVWNAAIETTSGVTDAIRLGTTKDGAPAMQLDSTASAAHLATTILAVHLPGDDTSPVVAT